jgi:hypothetical protein
MDNTTLLIIIVVLLLLGGGWYGRGQWHQLADQIERYDLETKSESTMD